MIIGREKYNMLDIRNGLLEFAAELELLQHMMEKVFIEDIIRGGICEKYGFSIACTFNPVFKMRKDIYGKWVIDLLVGVRYNRNYVDIDRYMEDKFGLNALCFRRIVFEDMESKDINGDVYIKNVYLYEGIGIEEIRSLYMYLKVLEGGMDEKQEYFKIVDGFNYGTSNPFYLEMILACNRKGIEIGTNHWDDTIDFKVNNGVFGMYCRDVLHKWGYVDRNDIEICEIGSDFGWNGRYSVVIKNMPYKRMVGLIHMVYSVDEVVRELFGDSVVIGEDILV